MPPLPPLPPLPPALDWIEVDGGSYCDDDEAWPKLSASSKAARATAGAAAVRINKADVAKLARVACSGRIWNPRSLQTGTVYWKDWKDWDLVESSKTTT